MGSPLEHPRGLKPFPYFPLYEKYPGRLCACRRSRFAPKGGECCHGSIEWDDGRTLSISYRPSPAPLAQVRTVNGAGLYRPLVTNHLILTDILIILGPICAEDFP